MRRRFGVHAAAYASQVERNGKPDRWISVNANSTALGAYFGGEFGEKATDKLIPDWVMGLPLPCLRAFLDAFIEGDGCDNDTGTAGRFRYTTIGINNPALMGGLYNIALMLGIDASMRLDKAAGCVAGRPVYQKTTLHP